MTTRLESGADQRRLFWVLSGFNFFSFQTHFHETVARVGVEAAPPSDPGFNLLNLHVVVCFEGAVSRFQFGGFPRHLGWPYPSSRHHVSSGLPYSRRRVSPSGFSGAC